VTELENRLNTIDKQAREATLVRALAETRLLAGHEFVYNRIFGSQILALKRLNEVGQATIDDVQQFFKPYAEQYPQLYSKYVIVQKDGLVEISDFGRDFLIYLTIMRLSENKLW
jgi:hypothetical protein